MKTIIKKTTYTFFKSVGREFRPQDYFIRVTVDGLDRIGWIIGYESTNNGLVCPIGGALSDDMRQKLEAEYQESIKAVVDTQLEENERDAKIRYWAKNLERKPLSLNELIEEANWLLANVK